MVRRGCDYCAWFGIAAASTLLGARFPGGI